MKDLFNEMLGKAEIPHSWREANISLIPKEDPPLTEIKNYRPISPLNSDYKLFTAILANRVKGFLKEFIHIDQNGFLPSQLRDNLRVMLNVLEYYENH